MHFGYYMSQDFNEIKINSLSINMNTNILQHQEHQYFNCILIDKGLSRLTR